MAPSRPPLPRRLFWRERSGGRFLRDEWGRPFAGEESRLPLEMDAAVREMLARSNAAPWHEYALELEGDLLIEPTCGWAVRGLRTRIEGSLPEGVKCVPAVSRYAAKRALFSRRAKRLESVISLRTGYETNYWHLFDDVLPRLALLDSLGVDPATPILVGAPLWGREYFRRLVERGPLRERTWIVQDGRLHVRSGRTYVSKTFPPGRERLEQVLRLLAVDTAADPGPERRLFVVRDARFGRVLKNRQELERIAAGAGFETVEPSGLDLDEQIALFGSARKVVGVHGAGLAGLAFRGPRPLDLLELFSPTWHGPQYFWLACALGHGYRGVFGESSGDGHDIVVRPELFERQLELLLAG